MAHERWIPDDIEQIPDVPFTDDSESGLALDLFRSRGLVHASRQPVVIWIHGGGWHSGDKERGVERVFGLVRRGFLAVSIDYRLTDEVVFPAPLHDCKCAVRFLRAQAAKFNVDPERIGAWGASAGGHLAALLAVTGLTQELEGERGWGEFSSEIQALCAWFAPSDLNLSAAFPPGVEPGLENLSADSAEGRLVGGAIEERQELVALANPIRHAHAACPPTLLMHGAKDHHVPLVASEKFHEALVAHRVPVHLHVIKNGHHDAYLWGDHHLEIVYEFFEWILRERAPGAMRT